MPGARTDILRMGISVIVLRAMIGIDTEDIIISRNKKYTDSSITKLIFNRIFNYNLILI